MIGVRLDPVDTWFFRDGVPFTAGVAPQQHVESLFPPHPPTVVGALRAALARANGWNGAGRWPPELCAVLGDGPEDLGALSFAGPFLLRDGQPLFRAPRHLLGASDTGRWRPAALLGPGSPAACDLGDGATLPELADPGGEAGMLKAGDVWLTSAGMNAALRGRLPDAGDVVSSGYLSTAEPRIGLQRDRDTRTAAEGMLYSTRHIRVQRGVALGVRIAGLPESWPRPFGLAAFGGESRLAECQEWTADLALSPPMDRVSRARKVLLVALSPVDLEDGLRLAEKPAIAPGGARVVCACLDRPQRIGGWNSLARRPLPVRSVLPPGSALFCELSDPQRFAAWAGSDGLASIGTRRAWGCGLVAVGVWPER